MENFSKFDKSFNINKISTYTLTLQLSNLGYAYCIIDTIRKQYVAISNTCYKEKLSYNNYLSTLKEIISKDVYLNKNYKNVNLIFDCKKFTLIPQEFFDKKKLKIYFEFNNPVENYEEIQFNNISEANIYNIFTIPSDITTYLVNKFPEIRFLQQGTVLIQHFINETKNSKSVIPTVVLNISPSHFLF